MTDEKKAQSDAARRRYKTQRLGQVTSDVLKPLLPPQQKLLARLLLDWAHIVKAPWIENTVPHKLQFTGSANDQATLTLLVYPAVAMDLQYELPQMIERINAYFGYALVARIQIQQSHEARRSKPQKQDASSSLASQSQFGNDPRLVDEIESIPDEALRQRLSSLYARLSGDKKIPPKS